MGNALNYTSFNQMIRLNRFNTDMKKLMVRLHEMGVGDNTYKLTPTIINLCIDKNISKDDTPVVVAFMRALRAVQNTYFVRFAAHLDWALTSECTDVFYTRGDKCDRHRDAIFRVHVVSNNHIELNVRIPDVTRQHLIAREISRAMYPLIPGVMDNEDESEIYNAMGGYHMHHRMDDMLKGIKDDFHILFVQNHSKALCYPIPLLGLTAADAIRRVMATERSLDVFQNQNEKIILDRFLIQEVIGTLVGSIQDSEERGDRSLTASVTYSLAELLFGYCLMYKEETGCERQASGHELIWFNSFSDNDTLLAEVFTMFMRNHPA